MFSLNISGCPVGDCRIDVLFFSHRTLKFFELKYCIRICLEAFINVKDGKANPDYAKWHGYLMLQITYYKLKVV